jgi:hypothetical protein
MTDASNSERRVLNVTLNKDGVIGPAMDALRTAAGAIVVSLRAIDEADLEGPVEIAGPAMAFRLEDGEADAASRRDRYRNWLLAKGFQDLARGLRHTLEEACLWVELVRKHGERIPEGDFAAMVEALRSRANRKNFPDLMTALNEGLSAKLHWEQQFMSLQKVRNCLEHRNGVVSADKDAAGSNALSLSIPRLQLVVKQGDTETELRPGLVVEKGGEVLVRVTTRQHDYAVGDRIVFTPDDFGEIAFACWMMAQDLATKLPVPTTKG